MNIITQLMAKRKALTSMAVGMFLIPLSALIMASGNLFEGDIFGMHPITVMMIAGIAVQAPVSYTHLTLPTNSLV